MILYKAMEARASHSIVKSIVYLRKRASPGLEAREHVIPANSFFIVTPDIPVFMSRKVLLLPAAPSGIFVRSVESAFLLHARVPGNPLALQRLYCGTEDHC